MSKPVNWLTQPTITISMYNHPFARDREEWALRYVITDEQAAAMRVGDRPPDFDSLAVRDWQMRMNRAEKFVNMLAADLAHQLVRSFNKPRDEP